MKRLRIYSVIAVAALLSGDALAVDSTWINTGPSTNWHDPLNWTAGVPAAASDTARFSSTSYQTLNVQLNQAAAVGNLYFNGRGLFRLGGSETLTFSAPGRPEPNLSLIAQGGALEAEINAPLELSGADILRVGLQGNLRATFNGVISGDGGIYYSGVAGDYGYSYLKGQNTYRGGTTVNLGTAHFLQDWTGAGFGDAAVGTTIRSGRVEVLATTAEPFRVETLGELYLAGRTAPHAAKITLAGGAFTATGGGDEGAPWLTVDSEIELIGRGKIGNASMGAARMLVRGNIVGGGSLVLEAEEAELAGRVANRGDVWANQTRNLRTTGTFAPRGDLLVTGGLTLGGDLSEFNGKIETRQGWLNVAADAHTPNLKIDARNPLQRESLNIGEVVVAAGATLNAGAVQFYAGSLQGRVTGVDAIEKRTPIGGALGGLTGFDGDVIVDEGWLDVRDAMGLGTTAGVTTIARGRDAAIVLGDGVRVTESIYLNDSTGIDGSGSLLGGGEMAGDLYLGAGGSAIGGQTAADAPVMRGGNLRITGAIHGGGLTKVGISTDLTIATKGHTYTGDTRVLAGKLILADAGRLATTSSIEVNGENSTYYSDHRATLQFNDRGVWTSPDRLADSVPVHLRGGRVELIGRIARRSAETIGSLHVDSGHNRLFASDGVLRLGQLTRQQGATAVFATGAQGQIQVGGASLQNGILGGWAIVATPDYYEPLAFATISGGSSVQAATMTQQSLASSVATQNVEISGPQTLAANVTVNSLRSIGANVNLGGNQLKIESGGLIATGETMIAGGTLTAGQGSGGDLILYGGPLNISAAVVDDGANSVALHHTSGGRVLLTGVNTYTGGTIVSDFSRLQIGNRQSIPVNDVVDVNGGTYELNVTGSAPVHLSRLILRSAGQVAGTGQLSVDADVYEAYSGNIQQALSGDGVFYKRGEGDVTLGKTSPDYTGPIVIEQGRLEFSQIMLGGLPSSATSTITVREEGILKARGLSGGRKVILEGGVIEAVGEGMDEFYSRIEVVGSGLVRGRALSLGSTFGGSGDLTLQGPFDSNMTVRNGFNGLQGDVYLTGGNVNLRGDSSGFTGVTYVRAAGAHASWRTAFGQAGAVVDPEGILSVDVALEAPLRLNGGKLISSAYAPQILRPVTVSADSVVELPLNWDGRGPNYQTMSFAGGVTLQDGVELKKTSVGRLGISGDMRIGVGTEIVAWEGFVSMIGTVIPTAMGSSLNLIGNENVFTTGLSVSLPVGKSFTLLRDGAPSKMTMSWGSELTGSGIIHNDVEFLYAGFIAPGASPGQLTVDGNATIGSGAVYHWELGNAQGVAGASGGWDLLNVTGTLAFTATAAEPWRLTLDPFLAPNMAAIMGQGSQQWLIASAAQITGFDPAAVMIDASALISERPQYAAGTFRVGAVGGDLFLTFAVPEPGAGALLATALGAGLLRRRRTRNRAATGGLGSRAVRAEIAALGPARLVAGH